MVLVRSIEKEHAAVSPFENGPWRTKTPKIDGVKPTIQQGLNVILTFFSWIKVLSLHGIPWTIPYYFNGVDIPFA